MDVTLRPRDLERDAEPIANLLAAEVANGAPSSQELRLAAARTPAGALRHHVVAEAPADATGSPRLAGCAHALRDPWDPAGRVRVSVVVDPTYRRRGIGGRLYADVLAAVRAAQTGGATYLRADVRDDLAAARRFAERRGFVAERHVFESVLDLAAFDPASFGEQIAAVARAGFRLASLAELGDTPEHRRRLYELNVETARDIPGSSGQTEPFEEYARGYFERESYRPDGQWLALDEAGQWAGLSLLAWDPQRRTVLHEMTGVRRAYRGRGLALPMKVMALTCAQTWSATHALTHNDSLNAPMLAVNHRLGYQRRPGFFKMYCYDLEREVS